MRGAACGFVDRGCVRIDVEQASEDLGSAHSVDQRVVDLGQDGSSAAVQSLDEPHVPQRPRPIERKSREVPDDLGELDRRARRGHGDAMEVRVEIEGALHPDRVVETQRDLLEMLAEDGKLEKAGSQVGSNGFEGSGLSLRPRRERDQSRHVHVSGTRLEREKG